MSGFLGALLDPSMPFTRNALIACLLSSVLFGTLGSVVTVKRIASLAGAISHAVLGGIGLALFLSVRGIWPGLPPLAGAFAFAIAAAAVIGAVSLKAKQREDTVINAVWAIGMSLGLLFISKTPGYADPMSYLFGNILLVSNGDLILLAVLDVAAVFLSWRFYPQLEACAFDEEYARTRGVPADAVFMGVLIFTALSVVVLQTFVGLVMVIAMLTLPAGAAGFRARDLAGMMFGATILSALFSTGGLALSWSLDLPSGAFAVALSGAAYLCAAAFRLLSARIKRPSGRGAGG